MSRYIDRAELFNRLSAVKTLAEAYAVVQEMPAAEIKNVPDTNVGDTISRQSAIDALGERPLVWNVWEDEYELGQRNQYDLDKLAIETVPSAERHGLCVECKHYDRRTDVCHNPRWGDGWANYPPPSVNEDFFCADWAKMDEVTEE